MLLDVRLALRRLRASPGFALAAIATLALAIGTTTTMVGVLDAVLLRRLPVPSPDRVVVVWTDLSTQEARDGRSAFGTVDAWREQSRSIEQVAVLDPVSVTLDHAGEIEQAGGARVSPDLFALFGVVPARGRLFTARDAADRQRVALISHRFWQTRFASSPAAVGASLRVDGQPAQIIGVLPPWLAQAGFAADVWEPHTVFADWEARRAAVGPGSWFVFARLRDAVGIDGAQRELTAIGQRLASARAAGAAPTTARLVPLREQLAGTRARGVAWLLTGATLLLWLVAAVNVAGLSIARGIGRLPQLAIQAALGASRGRLLRTLFAESAVLVVCAGAAGLAVAVAATRAIRVIGPAYVARLADVRLDLRIVAWAVAVSAATAMIVGLAPAIAAWRRDLRVTGVDGGRRSAAGAAARLRQLFVAGECAAAVVLLAAAGLFARSWWNVSHVDPGFDAERVVAVNLAPPAELPETQRAAFYERVLERVRTVPGVERAGIGSELFVGAVAPLAVTAEGSDRPGAQLLPLRRDEIAGEVFDTLGTPLLRGRPFTPADGHGPARVAIVNASMATRVWPGRDPVGRRFVLGAPDSAAPGR